MSKLFKNISIFSISLLLVLTTFTTNINADEHEIYTSESQVLSIELERNLKGQELELTFKNHVLDEEDIEIEKIVFQDEKEIEVEKNKDYLFKQIVGENGNYKFEITYTRTFLLEEENKEVKREETMVFYVAVNEIEAPVEDDVEVVEEKVDDIEEQEDEGIAYYFPKSDRVEKFTAEEIETFSARSSRATANITTGKNVSGAYSIYWKENPSFAWDFPGGTSEIYVNGEVGYCIEPTITLVSTGSATAQDLSAINEIWVMQDRKKGTITDSQKRMIALVANYGYEYEGHQTDNFRWATQKVIWEELGWVINASKDTAREEKIIRDLVAKHTSKPAWHNTTKKVKKGEVVDLSDPTISDFKIERVSDLEVVSHSGNTLKVKVTGKTPKLLLTKKKGVLEGTPTVYSDGRSQKVLVSKISDPILTKINFEIASGNIELEKVDENGKNVAGVEFAISKNSNMSSVLKKAKTNAQGKVSFTDLDEGTYYYQEVSVPSPLVIDKTIKSIVVNGGETAKAKVTNKIAKGNVQVIKQNTANQKVQGAKFNVLNSSGAVVDTLTTNSSGTATSKTLPLGSYSLVETFVPAPYILDSKPIPFALTYKDQNTPIVSVSKTQTNEIAKGKIEIVKKESAVNNPEYIDQKLANAVFELRAKNEIKEFGKVVYNAGDLVATLTTDKNGKAVKDNLPLGEYTLKETKAPEGYLLDDTVHTLSINYKDQNTAIVSVGKTLENKVIKGKIQVVKTDRTSLLTKGLPNAIFGVYKADTDEKVDEITTDKNGFAFTKELRYGNYYLQELKAPLGYWLDSTKYPVSIKDHDVVEVQHVGNDMIQAKIKVVKTDSDTDLPIENVEFKILDENNDVVSIEFQEGNEVKTQDTFITDKNGVFILQAYLPYGTYKLVETKAPEQYLPIDPIEFTIDENQDYIDLEVIGLTLPMEIENDWKKGNIEIAKVDLHSGEMIAGTVFELYDSEFNLIDTLTTDENGKAQVDDLKYGMYYIKEIEVPFPYVINPEKELQNIFVQEHGKTYTVTFENVKTEINIFKVDKETGEPIADTVFELYNEDKELLETLTTDETGVVTVEGLELGKYFVKEIEVPFPYVINPENELQELELTEENNSYDIKFENVKTEINIFKVDKETGEPIADTVFELYNEDKELLETLTTDETGVVTVEGLELGKYFVKEIEVPAPYVINPKNELQELELTEENNSYDIKFENEKAVGEITVIKTDDFDEVVGNAEFTLYDEDMNVVEVATTDENGLILFDNLPLGNYIVKETKAPLGYDLNEKEFNVELAFKDQNTPIIESVVEVENKRTEVDIIVKKVDKTTKEILKDAEFTLYDEDMNVVEVATTDENGIARFTVTFGNYKLKETKAPEGYLLSKEIIDIEIKGNEENLEYVIEFDNEIMPTGLVQTGMNNDLPMLLATSGSLITMGLYLVLKNKREENEKGI